MTQNVLEEVSACFTAAVVTQVGAVVGENEAAMRRALPKVVPLALSSLIRLAEQPGGADVLRTLARDVYEAGPAEPEAVALTNVGLMRRCKEVLNSQTGDNYRHQLQTVAADSGTSALTTESLLAITTLVTLGVLGAHADARNLNSDGLKRLLQSQRSSVSGLMLPVAAGGTPVPEAPYLAPQSPAEAGTSKPASRAQQWLVPALLLIGALIIGYFLGQNRAPANPAAQFVEASARPANADASATVAPVTVASGRYDAATENYIYDTGKPVRLTLRDGSTQVVGVNSTESKLYNFLVNEDIKVDPVNRTIGWINFDRVYFDAANATLTNESKAQLRNVASIMHSFPKARIKIGGYSDSTGNYMDNLKLSEARATTAMATLVDMGVPASRIEAKGYGPKHNVASNETPVGRSLNRRISVRVIQK